MNGYGTSCMRALQSLLRLSTLKPEMVLKSTHGMNETAHDTNFCLHVFMADDKQHLIISNNNYYK